MSESTTFDRILVQASAEALSGSAARLAPEEHPILNGAPYRAFRQSLGIEDRRAFGTFFSSPKLAEELASTLQYAMRPGGLVLDPTCGIGDLLIAFARQLPIHSSLEATLALWGGQLAGIDSRAELVAMTKARLIALARSRGGFAEPVKSLDDVFPHIVVGDMLVEQARLSTADGFLFNPPFGGTSSHAVPEWGAGKLSAAALFLDVLLASRAPGAPIAAVLPEVLRCGSRYARFRSRICDANVKGHFRSYGRFDAWTDIDVFTTLLISGHGDLWTTTMSTPEAVGDHFYVHVGAVVPHRNSGAGDLQPFICAKTVPAWSSDFTPDAEVNFNGTLFSPPFVVVRRTSSPSDAKRAVGAVIQGRRPVAVENHLIVLVPKDGRLESCLSLLNILAADATSEHLNRVMRCRHLTVGSVSSVPWSHLT